MATQKKKKSALDEVFGFVNNVKQGVSNTVNNVTKAAGSFYDSFQKDYNNRQEIQRLQRERDRQQAADWARKMTSGAQKTFQNAVDYFDGSKDTNPDKPGAQNLWTTDFMQRNQKPIIGTQRAIERVGLKLANRPDVKFAARTGVGLLDAATETLDFGADFIANNPTVLMGPGSFWGNPLAKPYTEKLFNPLTDFYNEQKAQGRIPTQWAKDQVDELQNTKYIRPSDEWTNSSLEEKFTTRLDETLQVMGPSIISSIAPYVLNPLLGVSMMVGSTANDVKDNAIKNGVDETNAEILGLATGGFVGFLDRIIPTKVFGKERGKFISGFVNRLANFSILTAKEGATEVAQENIQIAAESTFREDLGWDEIATRNAMALFGGILGGGGMASIDTFVNNTMMGRLTNTDQQSPSKLEITPEQTPQAEGPGELPAQGAQIQEQPDGGQVPNIAPQSDPEQRARVQNLIDFISSAQTEADIQSPDYLEAVTRLRAEAGPLLGQEFAQNATPEQLVEGMQNQQEAPVAEEFQSEIDNINENLKDLEADPEVTTMLKEDMEKALTDTGKDVVEQGAVETGPVATDPFDADPKVVQAQLRSILSDEDLEVLGVKDGELVTEDGKPAWGRTTNALIELVQENGKVQSKTAYHEALHRYVQKFANKDLYQAALEQYVQDTSLPSDKANEKMADDFAEFVAGRQGFTGNLKAFFQDLLIRLREFVGRVNSAEMLFYNAIQGKHEGGVGDLGTMYRKVDTNLFGDVEQNLTTELLTQLEGKTIVPLNEVIGLLKKPGIRGMERFITQDALNRVTVNGKVNVAALAQEIKKNLFALKAKAVEPVYGPDSTRDAVILPEGIRHPEAKYGEIIYDGGIESFAGQQHYGGGKDDVSKYFAHVRFEDLPDGTRVVLELQSDLMQSWLSSVLGRGTPEIDGTSDNTIEMIGDDIMSGKGAPTDEELKQAIKQYGLGSSDRYTLSDKIKLLQLEIEEGQEIKGYNKERIELYTRMRDLLTTRPESDEQKALEGYKDPVVRFKRLAREEIARAAREGRNRLLFPTGDTILRIEDNKLEDKGVMDPYGRLLTDKPLREFADNDKFKRVYDAYHEDLPKALGQLGREVNTITDERGVTWYEVSVAPEDANAAIPAFKTKKPSELPQDLKGAKPTYNYGTAKYTLNFSNDLDRAIYIVGNTKTLSPRDSDYLAFAKEQLPNMSETQIRELGQKMRNDIKAIARDGDGGEIDVPTAQLGEIQRAQVPLKAKAEPITKPSEQATQPSDGTSQPVSQEAGSPTEPPSGGKKKKGRPNETVLEDFPRQPGELNVNRLDLNKKSKKSIYNAQDNNPSEPISFEEVEKFAQRAGITDKSFTRENKIKIFAEQLNTRRRVVEIEKQIEALKKKKAPKEQIVKLLQERHDVAHTSGEQGRKTGQELRMRAIMADEINSPMNSVFQMLDQLGINPDAYLDKAADVDFNDPDQVIKFWRDVVPAKFSDWFDKLRYNAMLSSPSTHIINIASNVQGTGFITPIDLAIQGGIDAAVHYLTLGKHKRTRFAGEGLAYAKGFWAGQGQALKNAFNILLKGDLKFKLQQDDGPIDMKNFNPLMVPLARRGGRIPFRVQRATEAFLDVPSKFLSAEDQMSATAAQRGMMASLKYRESKGVKVKNIEELAKKKAERSIFRGELIDPDDGALLRAVGWVGEQLKRGANSEHKYVRWPTKLSIPFINIGTNLAKQGFESNPITGTLNLVGNKDKTSSVSKMIMGTAVTFAAMQLAQAGMLIGPEDEDKLKRDQGRAAGRIPWSIKVGDTYIQFNKMHPVLAFQLGMVAAVHSALEQNKFEEDDLAVWGDAMAKSLAYFNDQTYWRNVGNFVNAVNGDPYELTSLISNYPSQTIPYRALMSYVTRAVDEFQRAPDPDAGEFTKIMQKIQAGIPGLSTGVPTRKDPYGADMKWNMRMENLISPYRLSREDPDHARIYNKMKVRADVNKELRLSSEAEKEAMGSAELSTPQQKMEQKEADLDKEINRGQLKLGAEGGQEQIGEGKYQYLNDNGEVVTFDTSKFKKQSGGISKYKQEEEKFKMGRDIWDSPLSEENKAKAFEELGLDPQDVRYDVLANHTVETSTKYLVEKLSDQPHEIVLERLLTGRVESISGEIFVSEGVIDNLVDEGIISKEEGKWLKTVEYDRKTGTFKTSGGGSGKKVDYSFDVDIPNPEAVRLNLPSIKGENMISAKDIISILQSPERISLRAVQPTMTSGGEDAPGRIKLTPYQGGGMAKTLSQLGRA